LSRIKKTIKLSLCFALILGFVFNLHGQTEIKTNKKNINTAWSLKLNTVWSDNVFKLSEKQMDRFNLNNPGDEISGRYNDMESINDLIFSIEPKFKMETKNGLFNRMFSLTGKLNYQHYSRNTKKSFFKLSLSGQQKVSKNGTIIIEAKYIPSRFNKNYLLDATDSTGSVSSSERIYHEAVYGKIDLSGAYRHRFYVGSLKINSDFFMGYGNKSYNDEFPGRNQDAFYTGLALTLKPGKSWDLYLEYTYESVKSPITKEVMILDEPDYQIDFNNDGDFADNNRRTGQTVNRSHSANNLEFVFSVMPVKRFAVYAGAELTFKDYLSSEPIDPNYKDRNDRRTEFMLGFEYQILKKLFLMVEYKNINQQTDRPEDPGSVGEETDYITNIVKAGIQWRF
jgi:hypothetical protein